MALRRFALLIAVLLAILPASAYAQQAPRQIYWGAIVDGTQYGYGNVPDDMRGITEFEAHAGKHVSIIPFGNVWQHQGQMIPFYPGQFEAVRQHGSIPLFTWLSMGDDNSQFTNKLIADGWYDNYIRTWAQAAKAWGHPLFLRFDHEMDGYWYPWGEGSPTPYGPIVNGNTPGSYVRMYRHVHDIFAQVGAYNVTWVWAVNHQCLCPGYYPPLSQVFPGENYINWTGIDAYNRYPWMWLSFRQMLLGGAGGIADTYHMVTRLAPDKPMMLPEMGSMESASDPNAKAAWYRDAFSQITWNFPIIRAVVQYNWANGGPTLPIESSPQSQAAFATAISSPAYLGNTFSGLGFWRIS